MGLQVVQYKDYHQFEWDQFVKNSINGTLFHSRKFINYHPKERFQDDSLIIAGDNPKDRFPDAVHAVFPAAGIEDDGAKVLKSHPGTSYGGIIINKNLGIDKVDEIFELIENYAKTKKYDRIDFRIGPKIFFNNPCDQIDFIISKRGYYRDAEELSTCYNLNNYIDQKDGDILSSFSPVTRRNIKKAIASDVYTNFILDKKGISDFYDILKQNLTKHNTKPVHSLEEIIYLTKEIYEDVKILGAYYNDKLIAGLMIMKINNNGWHIFYSANDYNYQKFRPVNLLVFNLIKHLRDLEYNYLNYGISTEKGGKIINKGLFEFKEGFNGSGILRTYWQKKL